MNEMQPTALGPEIIGELEAIFGRDGVSTGEMDRMAYTRDLWPQTHIWMMNGRVGKAPDAIVWAKNEDQISQLLRLANIHKIPVIPYGAGSGVCGGTLPLTGGIILDVKKMDHILNIDDTALTVTAEAGVIGQNLEHELNRKGYTMGHFPSSIYCSTLGGYLAARSAGQLSARYGKIEDMVMSLRAVLPNGEIFQTTCAPRSATGPGFAQTFIGSEGTLAVITSAVMRIYPYPQSRLFRGVMFHGVHEGLEAIRRIMRAGILPACVRLYDELDTILIGGKKEESVEAPIHFEPQEENLVKTAMHTLSDGFQNIMLGVPRVTAKLTEYVKGKCLLILTFEGVPEMTQAELRASLAICRECGGEDKGEEPGKRWWENRYNVSYNQSRVFDRGSFVDTIEVATTWDKVETLYFAVRKAVSPHAFIMAHFSHAYAHGCCIYFSIVSRGKDEQDATETYRAVWDAALTTVLAHGAAISHHHGIGYSKGEQLKKELGPLMDVYRDIKKALDPNNILNPGKLGLP